MKFRLNKKIVAAVLLSATIISTKAQTNVDSLSFKTIVERVTKANPLVKQAEERINSAQWKEKLTESAYMPNVSASASITRLYPIPAFDLPLYNHALDQDILVHMQMVPDFNADCGIKVSQLIYDFGKTKDNRGLSQANTEINRLSVEQLKQQLSLATAGYFFTLEYIQSAISIKTEELKTLKQHLEYIEKKQQTGSATEYEILSTKVRISVTETQLTDLQISLTIQTSHLNRMMDTTITNIGVKDDINAEKPISMEDSLISYATSHRDDALMMEKKSSIAEWNYKVASSEFRPSLMFIGSTGFKNGYLPGVNDMKFNYLAGLSLNVPIFDGNRKHIKKQIAGSGIAETNFEKENLRNTINDEVKENLVSLQVAQQKINQANIQLEQAQKAYNHAQTNYSAGTITNLDMLDASNALSESKLQLLKAQIDYKLYYIKFKVAIGERLY
jgi:outer membrane protein TolC